MKEGESTSCGPKQQQKHKIQAVNRTIMKLSTLIRALTPSRLNRAAADSNLQKKIQLQPTTTKSILKRK